MGYIVCNRERKRVVFDVFCEFDGNLILKLDKRRKSEELWGSIETSKF